MDEPRIPLWLWRIVITSTTDNIGEGGTRTILRRSCLEQFSHITPEDDDTPSVTVDEFSRYIRTLFDIFGEEGARPILLRAGKIGFEFAYEKMPPLIRVASKILKVLPEKMRVKTVVTEFNKAFNDTLSSEGSVFEGDEKVIVEIPDCPHCRGLKTEGPACYVEVGLLSQLIESAVGEGYRIGETKCIAQGDAVCRFEIEKA
jgi:bacteriochlorophyll 4-vinyl reductase